MLSKRLREKREETELTQNEVAEELHVSPQSISKWERGEALPSVEFLPKLAEIYNCKIDDFFNEKISIENPVKSANNCISTIYKNYIEREIENANKKISDLQTSEPDKILLLKKITELKKKARKAPNLIEEF